MEKIDKKESSQEYNWLASRVYFHFFVGDIGVYLGKLWHMDAEKDLVKKFIFNKK